MIRGTTSAGHTIVLVLLVATGLTASAAVAGPPQQTFEVAASAYDEGRYEDAVQAYRDLVDAGFGSKEVLFNLGNAHFRMGDLGSAVLNYRRAWYLAPRDVDIRTNLGFALDHTGAVAPPATPAARVFRNLSLSEWILLATLGWWLTAICIIVAVAVPRFRRPAGRLLGVCIVLFLLAVGGIVQWGRMIKMREMVIVRPDQEARYAPLETSEAHFKLPEGSIVSLIEGSGDWMKVRLGPRDGWVRAASCAPVHGPQGPRTMKEE